ncbi:integrase catalytic domain-containing protein [Trichonephila clavipes]|nr:integrase catalytic domain-containing protein [Trichonephila clavipes]
MALNRDPSCLGNSRDIAVRQLNLLWKRLSRDSEYWSLHTEFLREYEELGHMKRTVESSEPPTQYYIPHRSILHPDKSTTKLRVVFNASTPTTTCKMYRQILLEPDKIDLQRIMWKVGPDAEILTYRLKTVTYGMPNAPFLAIKTLQQLARDEKLRFPLTSEALLHDTYMDVIASGAADLEANYCRNFEPDASGKTLGINWRPFKDYFVFRVFILSRPAHDKREVLSVTARLYDPLGSLGPVLTRAKKRLWQQKLDWDDVLPDPIAKEWREFVTTFKCIENVKINRFILAKNCPPGILGCLRGGLQSYYSTIALAWLNTAANQLKTFIAKRVSKIRRLTETCVWTQVPTHLNPADLVLRGLRPRDLLDSNLWWRGPSFLEQALDRFNVHFKLPKLELKKFSGEAQDFLAFWSQFQKSHDDKSIAEKDKMQCLLQSEKPKSKAERLVLSFPGTAENYPKAIDQLKERYDSEDLLVQIYLHELSSLVIKNAVSGRTKTDLPALYDELEGKLRSLENLRRTKEKYGNFLTPLVESCLT